MPIGVRVQLSGERELVRALERLGDRVAGDALEDAVMDGAEPIRQAAGLKAPRRRGVLATEVVKETKEKSRDRVTVAVGPSRDAPHGLLQEFGTRHHPAHPFLRPAFDENKDRVVDTIRSRLARRLGI